MGSLGPTPSNRSPILRDDDLLPALLFIGMAAFACLTNAQNDTWWHLRSGQAMWESRSFLTTEQFSFTAFGTPLHNHWWLSQVLFYVLHVTGGPFLLTIFAGGCALVAVYGSWRLLQGAYETRVVLLAFLVLGTFPEWAIRPQVISLALIVLSATLIVHDRIAWLPLVCLVWGNTHAMVIFGVLMAGACALEALVWTRGRLLRDSAVAAGCVLAPMLSPLGWEYWPRVLATVSMSKTLQIQEYRMPLQVGDLPFWVAAGAFVVLTITNWSRLASHARADRILVLASGALAIAAATAMRNVAFFAVVAAPAISRLLEQRPARSTRERPAGTAALLILTGAVLVAGAGVVYEWRDGGVRLGWRPISGDVLRAVDGCPEPTFNHLVDGGYLMWALPHRRVFVDSRMEAYPLELLRRSREADLDGKYEQMFQDYGIRCAVVARDSALFGRLSVDPRMTQVFADSSRAVFATTPSLH